MIIINPDKTLNVNGRKTFPVFMANICNAHFELNAGVEPCNPTKNSEFLFSSDGDSIAGINMQKSAWEATNVKFTIGTTQISSIPQNIIDSPNFFGYAQLNEPLDSQESIVSSRYNQIKARDTKHIIMMDHWVNMPKWIKYGDVITMWIYPFKRTNDYASEDSLYAYEHMAATAFFTDQSTGKFTEINTVSKPVYGGIQAQGLTDTSGVPPISPLKVRVLTYTTLTMDVKGIGFWGYLTWGGSLTSYFIPQSCSAVSRTGKNQYSISTGPPQSAERHADERIVPAGQTEQNHIFITFPETRVFTTHARYRGGKALFYVRERDGYKFI